MEKQIWVIGSDRREMLEAQRRINSTGSMRALCMLSFAAVKRAVENSSQEAAIGGSMPSLVIMDYQTAVEEDFQSVSFLKMQQFLAGVPLFFMIGERSQEVDEQCFLRGGMVVVEKPFSHASILRIEQVAWQHEVTRNYEKVLQKQAMDLQAAKEIVRLNQKLESRNQLLYQVFGRYFSDQVLEFILEHPEGAAIGGEKKKLAVMLADLRGFTSISEELEPEAVTQLLNFHFSKMVDIITKYKGTIIEFLGDGILAVFGAPLVSENETADAVAAAINMQNCMGEVNAYCEERGYPSLEMGIGIHWGEVFIGNVGSEKVMRYSVIGQAVNECSRIEGYSVGGQILVSKQALDTISCSVEVHNRIFIAAKGVHKPISVGEVVGIGGDYQCRIENVDFDVLKPVTEWTVFNLYPIEKKTVAEEPVMAVLSQFSRKRAVVTLLPESEIGYGQPETDYAPINPEAGYEAEELAAEEPNNPVAAHGRLELYADVEVFAAGREGKAFFNGVYAKVVDIREKEAVLHFTHVSRSFQKFANKILPE